MKFEPDPRYRQSDEQTSGNVTEHPGRGGTKWSKHEKNTPQVQRPKRGFRTDPFELYFSTIIGTLLRLT